MRVPAPLVLAAAAAVLGACATTGATQDVAPLYVRHEMQVEVNPAIVDVWDVGNNAMNDEGGIDASLLTDESWTKLQQAAGKLAASAERMASAQELVAAAPGNYTTEEYEVSMGTIQANLDAEPDKFRIEAARFAAMARRLETAAATRDAATASELVAGMDSECAVCHSAFWYAE
jgi:cytochrome c556